MPRNDFDDVDKAVAGLGCAIITLQLAFLGLVIWAIIRLVLHFT